MTRMLKDGLKLKNGRRFIMSGYCTIFATVKDITRELGEGSRCTSDSFEAMHRKMTNGTFRGDVWPFRGLGCSLFRWRCPARRPRAKSPTQTPSRATVEFWAVQASSSEALHGSGREADSLLLIHQMRHSPRAPRHNKPVSELRVP